jgi:hypothetical protein
LVSDEGGPNASGGGQIFGVRFPKTKSEGLTPHFSRALFARDARYTPERPRVLGTLAFSTGPPERGQAGRLWALRTGRPRSGACLTPKRGLWAGAAVCAAGGAKARAGGAHYTGVR